MKIFPTTLTITVLLASVPCHAETVVSSRYQPESRSSFSPDGKERNPFWPIGWVKPAKVVATKQVVKKAPLVTLPQSAFAVTTILLGELSLAVINGGEYTVGETFTVKIEGQAVRVVVRDIGDGFVKLSPKRDPSKITRVKKIRK